MEAECYGHVRSKAQAKLDKPTAFVMDGDRNVAMSGDELAQNAALMDRPVGLALASSGNIHLRRALPSRLRTKEHDGLTLVSSYVRRSGVRPTG
jgi:hypothetical protein